MDLKILSVNLLILNQVNQVEQKLMFLLNSAMTFTKPCWKFSIKKRLSC